MYVRTLLSLFALLLAASTLAAQDCFIELELVNIDCGSNGTPNDPTDDIFEFIVAVGADNASPDGFVYFSSDNLLSGSGQYGQNLTLGPVAVADAPISLSVVDVENPNCNRSIVIELPPDCGSPAGECGTGELVIALAQDTLCRGGEELSVAVLADPTGQPAGYDLLPLR
jgi:hypothetical protein